MRSGVRSILGLILQGLLQATKAAVFVNIGCLARVVELARAIITKLSWSSILKSSQYAIDTAVTVLHEVHFHPKDTVLGHF